jgi:hypothetical protein
MQINDESFLYMPGRIKDFVGDFFLNFAIDFNTNKCIIKKTVVHFLALDVFLTAHIKPLFLFLNSNYN